MTYYVVLSKEFYDGTDTKKAMYTFDTLAAALASWHSQLGSAIGASTTASVMATIISQYGQKVKTDYWEAATSTEESEISTEESETSTEE